MALTRYDMDTMLTQSQRALAYLSSSQSVYPCKRSLDAGLCLRSPGRPDQGPPGIVGCCILEQAIRRNFTLILASIGLGNVQEADNQLYQAAETYQGVLRLAGEHPQQIIHEAHLGMARIRYEWNDLDSAKKHVQQSIQLARQYDVQVIDRFILCEVFLARLKLAQGDLAGCEEILQQVDRSAHRPSFTHRLPEIAAERVRLLLQQRNLAAAENLANMHQLPLSQARVYLAQGNFAAAQALMEGYLQQVEAKVGKMSGLRIGLQAMAYQANDEKDSAVRVLGKALALAEPGGFIRIFVDEGLPMMQLLAHVAVLGVMPDYLGQLSSAFKAAQKKSEGKPLLPHPPSLIEPLSQRELEILRLIAQGLSNREISERLFLALITVKVHNHKNLRKIQAKSRTEAVARARDLGLL